MNANLLDNLRATTRTAHPQSSLGIRMGRGATVAGLALLALLAGALQVRAQSLEVSVQVEVPVLGDNLDQAKTRAIREAESQSLLKALDLLVAPEWRSLYDRDLNRRFLPRLDRYLSGFRTTRAEPSSDRTKYVAAITAQFARVPLAEDLRTMQIPVLGDPKRTVRVLYAEDDPFLASPQLRQEIVAQLQPRLDL